MKLKGKRNAMLINKGQYWTQSCYDVFSVFIHLLVFHKLFMQDKVTVI